MVQKMSSKMSSIKEKLKTMNVMRIQRQKRSLGPRGAETSYFLEENKTLQRWLWALNIQGTKSVPV